MIAAEIIGQVLDAGGQIAVDGGDLVLTAPRPLPADLLDTLKAHKPAILAALAAPAVTEESVDADRRGWGAMTTAALLQAAEAAGMAIRVDGDALAYEIYSGGPPGLWNEIRGRKAEILAHANALDPGGRIVTLAALIRGAPGRDATKQGAAAPPRECDQSGVPPELAARRSAEDLEDIKAGDITLGTVQAFEQAAIARETEGLKEFFEEHAGILYDAGLPRAEADAEVAKIAATFARNRS